MNSSKLRIVAVILLCVALAGALSACSQDNTPDGYQLVACEGDRFRLYVPTQWMPNIKGGVTGAITSMDQNVTVNVYIADDAGDLTLEEYWQLCDEKMKEELDEYSPAGKSEKCVLGGQTAYKNVYSAKVIVEGKITEYKFMHVCSKYNGEMYVLIYSAPKDYYDTYIEDVEGNSDGAGIIPYFVFAEPYHSEDNDKQYSDEVQAPDGMKLISTDERAYRFFVPTSWTVNNRTEATAAYFSDDDRSNVSVQMYMTDNESQTVEEYWETCQASYKEIFAQYSLVSDREIDMDGIKAREYVITVTSGGEEIKMLQAIVKKGSMFYCVTYTSTPENYGKHIDDVQKMIENFDIR